MDEYPFSILTWNDTGIMSSAAYLSNCLNQNKVDICGFSEHWLYYTFSNQIDKHFCSLVSSDSDLKGPSNRRVGNGGVAF